MRAYNMLKIAYEKLSRVLIVPENYALVSGVAMRKDSLLVLVINQEGKDLVESLLQNGTYDTFLVDVRITGKIVPH